MTEGTGQTRQVTEQATEQVTIRTLDKPDGSMFVDITLKVKDGRIVEMFGVDKNRKIWKVKKIKFTGSSEDIDNDECQCCEFDPRKGRIVCVTCDCG